MAAVVVHLDGLHGAVLKDNVQLQQILADGVGGQNQHVVGAGGLGLSLEEDHVGQLGGLIGLVGGLVQSGVDLNLGVIVHIAHVVPAGGHAVLNLALGVRPVVEGNGVLVHGVGLLSLSVRRHIDGAAAAGVAVHSLILKATIISGVHPDDGGVVTHAGGAAGVHAAVNLAGTGLQAIALKDALDGQHVIVGQGVGDDGASGHASLVVGLTGLTGLTGLVDIAGAQVGLQLLVVGLALDIISGFNGIDILHCLGGVLPVDAVGLDGAVGHEDLDLAGAVQGVQGPGGVDHEGIVGDDLLSGADGDHIAVGVQDKVVAVVKAGLVLGVGNVKTGQIHVHQGGGVQNVGLAVLFTIHGDKELVGLVAVHAGHLAGDNLGGGDVGAAAVLHVEDQVVGGHLVVEHYVLKVLRLSDGLVGQLVVLVITGRIEGDCLVLLAVGAHLGQSLAGEQHVLGVAIVVVVDDLNVHTVQVELVAVVGGIAVVVDQVVGILFGLAVAVVHVELGALGDGHAGALQVILHGALSGSGGVDHVHVVLGGHAQHLGIGQDGGLLDVHGHGLAQEVNGGVHIEGNLTGLGHALVLGGVGGGGGVQNHVVQHGLAILQSGVGVGLVQLSPLVAHHNALHLVHAVHGGQDGAGIGVRHGVAVVGVALDHLHVQGVVDEQSGVVAAQRLGHGALEVAEDAQLGGQGVGVDLPVGAGQALDSGIVASGHQQHLGGLGAGHARVGVKLAVAAAGNDAGGVAVVDVALGPVAADVSQAGGAILIQGAVIHALIHDDGDHLRHLGAVHALGGGIGAVGLSFDDAQRHQHGNGVLVHDLILIGEIVVARSGGGDNHHADEHDRRQSQAESPLEVSHLDFLLLNFEA